MKMKFATVYTPNDKRSRPATVNKEPSLTQQSDANDADINVIMAKYGRTGQLPAVNMLALDGDFSDVGDFSDAQQRIIAAREAFQAVPATVRKRFDNNPQQMIDFLRDPANKDEAIKLGLVDAPPDAYTPANPAPTPETPKA